MSTKRATTNHDVDSAVPALRRRRSCTFVMSIALAISLSGCRTGSRMIVSCVGSLSPTPAESVATPGNHLIPPPPAPENLRLGMSAHPPVQTPASLAARRLFDPSSPSTRSSVQTQRAPLVPLLAPPETSLGPDPAPAAAPVTKPQPVATVNPEPPLETRLALLEEECRGKLSALEALESKYEQQSAELSQVRQQLDTSRGDVATLTDLVGNLHRRDVASLEQLSQSLDGLLETTAAPPPSEAN